MEYLDKRKIIMTNQSSLNQSNFCSNHSCETALQLLITKWKQAIDKRYYIDAVFLDLKRAFEVIDQDILISKLEDYGIQDTVIKWIRDYLNKRKQITNINNTSRSRI